MFKEVVISIWHILIAPFILALRVVFKTLITPFLLFFDILFYGLFTLPLAAIHKFESFLPENFSLTTFSEILHVAYYYIFVASIVGAVCALVDLVLIQLIHNSVRFSEYTITIPYLKIPLVFQGGLQNQQDKEYNGNKGKPERLITKEKTKIASVREPTISPARNIKQDVGKSSGYQNEPVLYGRSGISTSESDDSANTTLQMSHRDISTVRTESENTELK